MQQEHRKMVPSVTVLFWIVCGCALALYLTIAALLLQKVDLYTFNLPWAISGARDGVFSIYCDPSVDYPPLYLALLSCFGAPLSSLASVDFWPGMMLLLKFWPVFFEVALAVVIFYLLRNESLLLALLGGVLWLLNPSIAANSVWWGQTDALLCFALLLTFWFFYRRRPELALLFFALGCLVKLQMCYFAPIVLCELFFYYPLKRGLISMLAGIGIGVAGWLPFMISMKSVSLPFTIYFGGFSKYPYTHLNAANLYGLTTVAGTPADTSVVGGITFAQASTVVLVSAIAAVCLWYLVSKRTGIRVEAAVVAMLYSNVIFLFTTAQHERYQIPVMLLAFLWYLISPRMSTLILYLSLTAVTFFNQAFVLLFANYGGIFDLILQKSIPVLSVCNLLLFCLMIVLALKEFFRQKRQKIIRT